MASEWDIRIVALFQRGYSMDLISELGVGRWRRADVQSVVADRGWALDYSGRLQPQHMREASFDAVPLKHPAVEEACADRIIDAGIDHHDRHVATLARKASEAVEALRAELLLREEVAAGLSARWKPLSASQTRSTCLSGTTTPDRQLITAQGNSEG
jgi:hypothetical protein